MPLPSDYGKLLDDLKARIRSAQVRAALAVNRELVLLYWQLGHPEDRPTIGVLLCKGRDRLIVEYALRDLQKPIGVAEWTTRLVESLPDDMRGSLPSAEELEAELCAAEERAGQP